MGSAGEELGENLVVPVVRLQMPGFVPESQVRATHHCHEVAHGIDRGVGVMLAVPPCESI